jgi:hypothetical protein
VTKELNLKELERKALTSYHQDGLIDIFASLYIIGFSVGIFLDYIWDFSFGVLIPGFLVVLVVPLWIAAKRKITMPRIGYVNFGTKGKSKITAIFVGLLVLGVAFFFAFTLYLESSWLGFILENGLIAIGIGALLLASLFGYATGIKRFYAYGIIAFTLFAIGYLFEIFFAYIVLALGLTLLSAGIAVLTSFIRRYPLKGDQSFAK